MSAHAIAVTGFVLLFVLMLLRVPVGIAMGLIGIAGFGFMTRDFDAALALLAQSPIRTVADVQFAVIPLFLLMGAFASASGMSRELFRVSNAFPPAAALPPSAAPRWPPPPPSPRWPTPRCAATATRRASPPG